LPNPFSSSAIFRIRTEKNIDDATITIYNLYGQAVKQIYPVISNYIPLSGEDLAHGIYIYRLTDKKGMVLFNGKFIIN
jgi:hypothetical protein